MRRPGRAKSFVRTRLRLEILRPDGCTNDPATPARPTSGSNEWCGLLEPGSVEHKYYAPGVGTILETDPEGEERVELVSDRIGPP
jgi:hypothetical protein